MNKEDLFKAIGQVDDELLVDLQAQGHHAVSTAKKRNILAFAACLCLVVVGVFAFFANDDFSGESAFVQWVSTQAALETTVAAIVTDSGNLSDDVVTSNALATEPFVDSNTTTSATQTTGQDSQTTVPYGLIDSYSTSEIEYIGTPFTQAEIDDICETYELYYIIDTDISLEDCYYSLTISETKNTLSYDRLYYNVYSDGSLVQQVVFTKTDELGYELLAFDSVSYFTFVDMLEKTQGQTVYSIIILNNYIQAYLSEDGSFYCTYDLSSFFDDDNVDYVEAFGCEENVFK